MSRDTLHLTVAAIVCYQQRFLLVEEIDKLTGKRVLNQPAGHVEPDEDLLTAVARELQEETGLQLQPCAWLGLSQLQAANGHRYVRINFVFEPQALPHFYAPQDSDILALHWLDTAQIAKSTLPLRSQLVSDAIALYQQGIRLPLMLIQPPR
ncbi:MAG: NUDIX domain-containing protein [Gammaproteobacteria bacterium]|nr:NUDIX domain-containing protein [Gammaproteobacteria bacterium]MBU1553923.1 NUDIX domain-containing protein [Gammaproteobacteria bacterium]MBU2071258.1 NUDIX domain-containing protein [Gammaproteobacteria bacterium]MBU2181665.1 NUDIX domain-containing protein [Gammaproteobacteria bacterium]MBU2205347.1 NUDIX domain-containing protein [Gammaproteobacteria bacterium]